MRDAFPYESNALLIREALVPDPLSQQDWERLINEWEVQENHLSLLEHLALHISEDMLLAALAHYFGVNICECPQYLEHDQLDATGHLLRSHGFEILLGPESTRRITGGFTLNPDLSEYLGASHSEWEWVLVSPVRTQPNKHTINNQEAALTRDGLNWWLRELISGLWSGGARDIHFERADDRLTVRAHTGMKLRTVGTWTDGRASTVVRLLCIWSGLSNWNSNGLADGTMQLPDATRIPRMRLSAIPTVNGESLVLRAPNPAIKLSSLGELGLPQELVAEIHDIALMNPGMIVCSGSTGSGKTTTLYGILNELKDANLKILTIEDPVEQIIPFAVQSSLDHKTGWSFDRAIRSFLRQDPDVIMVGEIRDSLSAHAACRAALTGHCVLTTMHASEAAAVWDRFRAWGIGEGILSESLRLVIHQRMSGTPDNKAIKVNFKWKRLTDSALAGL